MRWNEQELEILRLKYGLLKPFRIRGLIKRATGRVRSVNAIKLKANRLGLNANNPETFFTVKEIARFCELTKEKIYHAIERGIIKANSGANVLLISSEQIDALIEHYKPIPDGYTLTKQDLMRVLGYSETQATRLLLSGAIRGVKHGERWYVDKTHVESIAAKMKATGATRLCLKGIKSDYLDEQRRKNSIYQRTIRKERRRAG